MSSWRRRRVGKRRVGVRNPVLYHRVRLFSWFLSFGNRNQNSRVAGARPNHLSDRGSDPNHRRIWSPPSAGLGW